MGREGVIDKLLSRLARGFRLRSAALVAGVHVSTVCRWQTRDPELRAKILDARRGAGVAAPTAGAATPGALATGLPAVRRLSYGRPPWPASWPWAAGPYARGQAGGPRAPQNAGAVAAPLLDATPA